MDKQKFNIKDLPEKIKFYAGKVGEYKLLVFIVFIVLIYGYSMYQINVFVTQQPSTNQVQTLSNPIASAHIDKSVVTQLQALQNNSVSVQTLFEQARTNPFQEP